MSSTQSPTPNGLLATHTHTLYIATYLGVKNHLHITEASIKTRNLIILIPKICKIQNTYLKKTNIPDCDITSTAEALHGQTYTQIFGRLYMGTCSWKQYKQILCAVQVKQKHAPNMISVMHGPCKTSATDIYKLIEMFGLYA